MIRGGLYGVFAIIALAFALAAVGTDIATWGSVYTPATGPTQEYNNKATVWYTCTQLGAIAPRNCAPVSELHCGELKAKYRAAEAFYVMTIILLALAIIFAVLDHGNVHGVRYYKLALILFALLSLMFSVVGWGIALGIPRKSHCGYGAWKDYPNFEWGASPFLLIVCTFFTIGMTLIAFLVPFSGTEHLRPHAEPKTSVVNPPVAADPHAVTHHQPVTTTAEPVATTAPYTGGSQGAHPV